MIVEEFVGCGIAYAALGVFALFAGACLKWCPCCDLPVREPHHYI